MHTFLCFPSCLLFSAGIAQLQECTEALADMSKYNRNLREICLSVCNIAGSCSADGKRGQ